MEKVGDFVGNDGKLYDFYYTESIKSNEGVYSIFLGNCQEVVDRGHALKGWNFQDINYQGILCFCSDKLVGYYVFRPDNEMLLLTDMFVFVDATHREQGIGTYLLEYTSKWGKKNGYRAICSPIHYSNQVALTAALSVGYQILPFYSVIYPFKG